MDLRWALVAGYEARCHQHLAEGLNKAALARALTAAGGPVLILLDELMDDVMPVRAGTPGLDVGRKGVPQQPWTPSTKSPCRICRSDDPLRP
jgi:hypothetical protein